MIASNIATENELNAIDEEAKKEVLEGKKNAWNAYLSPMKQNQAELTTILKNLATSSDNKIFIDKILSDIEAIKEPLYKDILVAARKTLRLVINDSNKEVLSQWIQSKINQIQPKFSSNLTSTSTINCNSITEVKPNYATDAELIDARVLLRDNFNALFEKYPEVLIFGEDAGTIGDVNQGLEGMQEKYGELRVADVGIREASIIGQGIGMAMRGLRPIAEIQYLDYLLYAIQILSDDLATLHYRTAGRQKAPLIIRTRGHRLEGVWHSGSPLGMIINSLRGINVLVPRNMTVAAGFYNALLKTDEPALIIECLNGYRLKEKAPTNYGEFQTPIGYTETLKSGNDITVVSYGSTLRLIEQAANELMAAGIDVEIIDVQSLLPFDKNHDIAKSIQKTNRLLIIDEDLPGGASAYIMQQVLEVQNAYNYLDSAPQTLTAQPHRPAYGTDGDYFSKPSVEDIYEKIHSIMNEVNPLKYNNLY